jgi:hypothetical protein
MSALNIFTILAKIAMIPPCGFDGLVRFVGRNYTVKFIELTRLGQFQMFDVHFFFSNPSTVPRRIITKRL